MVGDPPRCECKATCGLYAWRDRWWCPACLANRIVELEAIVAELPKCWRLDEADQLVQDVPVVPGMNMWICLHGQFVQMLVTGVLVDDRVELLFHTKHRTVEQTSDCYSTHEAAEAAKAEK